MLRGMEGAVGLESLFHVLASVNPRAIKSTIHDAAGPGEPVGSPMHHLTPHP